MSSWDKYVSEQLISTGTVQKGAICGLDGAVWAVTPGWNLTATETKILGKAFTNPADLSMTGIMLAGEKYFFISGNNDTIRGKKGANGIHAAKTMTALIIGYYEDPVQPGQCAKTVEALSDYLKSCNY